MYKPYLKYSTVFIPTQYDYIRGSIIEDYSNNRFILPIINNRIWDDVLKCYLQFVHHRISYILNGNFTYLIYNPKQIIEEKLKIS